MNYKIPNLFLEAFGVKVEKAYKPSVSSGKANDTPALYKGIETVDEFEATEMSYLGTPILFPITFLQGSYKKYNNLGEIVQVPMNDFRLPSACIVDFKRSKNISETMMNGGYSEVNEIYGFKSWEISIMGFYLNDPSQPQGHVSAFDQARELVKWDDLASSIDVIGFLFEEKNIHSITIKDISESSLRGQPGIRPFQINAKSDEPIELLIRNP